MNTLKFLTLSTITVIMILAPQVAHADFKSEIIDSCTAYQTGKDTNEVNACKLYIDGFIDSSLLTEEGIIKPKAMIERQPQEQSDYLKRAYQTRLLTTSSLIANEDAHQFCIPREYDRKVIASTLAKSLDINQLNDKPLKQVLFDTLIADFPCRQ